MRRCSGLCRAHACRRNSMRPYYRAALGFADPDNTSLGRQARGLPGQTPPSERDRLSRRACRLGTHDPAPAENTAAVLFVKDAGLAGRDRILAVEQIDFGPA